MISEARLRELIAADEGQYHDRKSLFEGPPGRKQARDRRDVRNQIAEQVAGFANADGGVLILGVEDDGSLTGHRYPDDVIEAMLNTPCERLDPPQGRGACVVIDGKQLLVFEVESAPRAVMVSGGGFLYRSGDSTLHLAERQINAIKDKGIVGSAEAQPSAVALAALDASLLERAMGGDPDASPADYLVGRRLAVRKGEALELCEAAVLLFAAQPETVRPLAGVRVFCVEGNERVVGGHAFETIEGNLPTVVERVLARVQGWIKSSPWLQALYGIEKHPTFPWHEAIVNAVAHRDYANKHQAVEVWLFNDRLEVSSPGAPLPEVALDKLRVGQPTHASRNPRIARVLKELGVMRDHGAGVPRMFEEMEGLFLAPPTFYVEDNRFRVVVRKEPIFDDLEWARAIRSLPVSLGQKKACVVFVGRAFTEHDYAVFNITDAETARRELGELVERGLVERTQIGDVPTYQVIREAVSEMSAAAPWSKLRTQMAVVGFITNADVRNIFGVDRDRAKSMLKEWVDDGILILEGEKRGARYRPGAAWAARPGTK